MNAGNKIIKNQAIIFGFGRAWFNKDQIANMFGLTATVDRYRVMFDSAMLRKYPLPTGLFGVMGKPLLPSWQGENS